MRFNSMRKIHKLCKARTLGRICKGKEMYSRKDLK